MKVQGGCHGGQVTYEADVDPEKVTLCHCTDCQMLSGSAYRVSVPVARDAFTLLTGDPKVYIKTADSGTRRAHAFCPNCGSPIHSSAIADPPTYSLRVGCLRQRADLPAKRQIWCRSALAWASNVGTIPQLVRQ